VTHSFTFFRAGGSSYQVSLDRGADIAALSELDQKLWVALACPVSGLELDKKTLELVDTDGDGSIRPPEILAAVAWMDRVLVDLDELPARTATLELDQIDATTDEGKEVLASAKTVLENLGEERSLSISLEHVLDTERIFAQTRFNGDGVVPVDAADDEFVRGVLAEIVTRLGPEPDRSGKQGVSRAKLETFFEQTRALAAFHRTADASKEILPLGQATAVAHAAFGAVEAKIEDYFVRCRLAAFDARSAAPLNRTEADWAATAGAELSSASDSVASFPLARVEAGRALPLETGVNPAWAARVAELRRVTVAPLLGDRASLSDSDFAELRRKLAAYRAHLATKPAALDGMTRERALELDTSTAHDAIKKLVDADEAVRPQVDAIARVEKLLRYKRDLHRLLCNFVSFRDFYLSDDAMFQAGTLYLDERSCDLCVRVEAAGAHAEIAGASNTFLVYCECTRKGSEKMTIAAALTAGDEARVHAGRNGVFYDRAGRDWNARVVKVVKQPISIREAFWLPYRRIGSFIGQQIEKFAGDRDKEVEGAMKEGATLAKAGEEAPEKSFDVARFAGILAAVGLAIGAIGSALAVVLTSFFGLTWWQMPLALAGMMLAISGPSMLIAYLKLRARMLGPVLDGAGWAVNAEARINIAFGTSLTERGVLPSNAHRIRRDLYPDKTNGWIVWATAALIGASGVLWKLGYLKPWLTTLLHLVKKH
jgi:hypothetical protein